MKKLYIKTKFGIKEIVHHDDAAKMLKIKPSTLSSYLTREQIFIKKVKIKNLVFFYKEDLDKVLEYKNKKVKAVDNSFDLFSSNSL